MRMRIAFGVALLVMTALVAVGRGQAQQAAAALVVQGGTVIDIRTGALQTNSTVVIQGDRITAVGPAAQVQAPAGATVVNAAGKFVIPGLWDSHVHTRDYDGDLNINHGVTSTMDMGNAMDWIQVLKDARERQLWIGPRIFFQGMSIGGALGPHQWNARNIEEAVAGAKENIAAGASFLKMYSNATPEMVRAVTDIAHALGINVTAHLRRTNVREAIENGVDAIAHGRTIPAAIPLPQFAERLKARALGGQEGGDGPANIENPMNGPLEYAYEDPAQMDELIKLMVSRNVRFEPNIVQEFHGGYPEWDRYQLETHRLAMLPQLGYMRYGYELYVRMWDTAFTFPYPPTGKVKTTLDKAYANHQMFVKKFSDAGGKLFTGTDNYYHVIAGLGLWHEMELLGAAGVAPLKILQAATINQAEFVHQDNNLGAVEKGKLADILILARNPLQDIKNIRSLETVIQHGKVQTLGYNSGYRITIPRPYLPVNGALPQPHITSVSPVAVPMGSKNVVITVKGKDFNRQNRVLFGDLDVPVVSLSPTELKIALPDDVLNRMGTYKVHMVTGGRDHRPSLNFQEVMITGGKRVETRFNGRTRGTEW